MDNKIQELFSELINQSKISGEDIKNFGKQIGVKLFQSSEDELTTTLDTIYLGLLRKGHVAFDAYDSNYDHAFMSYLRTGINEQLKENFSFNDTYDFSTKLREITENKYDLPSLVIKQVAVCLAEDVNNETMTLKLNHLSNEIIRYTSHTQPNLKKTSQQITEAWNIVYDEFSFHNRLDLIPQLATIAIKDLNSGGIINNTRVKPVIQGLSNLKDSDLATLDFSVLTDKLVNKPTDSIGVLVNTYYQNPTESNFKSIVKDLTQHILSQNIAQQALLWDKVRENFSIPLFKDLSNKHINIMEDVAKAAIEFINTSEEHNAMIKGVSGMIDLNKKDNLAASITNMRHKFTGEYAVPTKKIV